MISGALDASKRSLLYALVEDLGSDRGGVNLWLNLT